MIEFLTCIWIVGIIIFLLLMIDGLRTNEHNTLLIYPTFTEQAYQKNGWYDNQEIKTVSLSAELDDRMKYSSGMSLYNRLDSELDTTSDIIVSKNPELLQHYNTIVLLHNEYVTVEEYDAIMNHSNVIYLFPNSLYRYVEFDDNYTMTLLRETGNPMSLSKTEYTNEFDDCITYNEIVDYHNGKGLSCYPNWLETTFNPFFREDIRKMIFDG